MKVWRLIAGVLAVGLVAVLVLLLLRPREGVEVVSPDVDLDTESTGDLTTSPRRLRPVRIQPVDGVPEEPDPDDEIVAADGGASRFAADDDGLDAAIEDIEPKVRNCYQDVLDVDPGVHGIVEVSFVLMEGNGAGRLDHVKVTDDHVHNATLASCIADRLSELSFDLPDADIELTVPFEFVTDDAPRDPLSPDPPEIPEAAIPLEEGASSTGD